jgi:hypothetical protein
MEYFGLVYLGIWMAVLAYAVVMVRRLVVGVERIADALDRGKG